MTTALLDFDSMQSTKTVVPVVTTTVTVIPQASARSTDVGVPCDKWNWEMLRDYVVRNIEQYHGPFPRNFQKEASIFKSFISRWGDKAPLIARSAFEDHHGMWRSAPISVNRFTKGSDPFFAAVISSQF